MRITTLTTLGLLTFFLLAGNYVFSQPISSFPYSESFDLFPASLAGSGSIVEPAPVFPGDWGNVNSIDAPPDNDGLQDWHAVSGGTPSGATGPTADHTSGSGRYLYIEDSGADRDSISLLSPIFNVTALSSPTLSIWVHSNVNEVGKGYLGDTSYNDLKIEVFSGGAWVLIDSIGALNTDWTEFIYDLSSYTNILRFRFRANNNNLGDFVHDIAIDDFSIFDFPDIEAALVGASIKTNAPTGYQLAPISQGASYDVQAVIRNAGKNTLTNVKVVADFGTYKDSGTVASLISLTNDILSFNSFTPVDDTPGTFTLSLSQNDTTPGNNSRVVLVNDSTFARDDSVASGALGFTGATGIFGDMYELTAPDVLTSSSFFLNNPPLGDSVRILLFGFGNQLAGEPDTIGGLLDSTDYLVISRGGWITLPFKCQPELTAGQYFIAVEQVNLNNVSCGYDADTYIPGVAFFGDGINRWVEISAVPSLISSFMVRMNFGTETAPKAMITSSATALCVGDTVSLNSTGGLATYNWLGVGVQSAMAATTKAVSAVTGTFPYVLMGVDANGCASQAITMVTFDPLPSSSISGDTTICAGENVTLTASGGTSYSWNNGDMTPMTTVSPTDTTTYDVTVSIGGCGVDESVTVNVPEVFLHVDLAVDVACNGDSTGVIEVSSFAPGSVTYSWSDDANATSASRNNLPAGMYTITVTDDGTQCSSGSMVTLGEPAAITLTPSAFGATNGNTDGFAIIAASGGTAPFSYAWNDGAMQTGDTAVNLGPGTYSVIVTDDNGCIDSASVTINEYGVGIEDLLNPALVKVYPNPNNGQFVLSGLNAFGHDAALQIHVYDLNGKNVFSKAIHAQNELHINLPSNRAAGVYMIHIQSESMRLVKRVMIK